ncbi:hypothetical protein MIR68_007222 [Amoeboaphelidium protococcarum]|nr:hypothetical protein MIR68_007222 [Amoeboaphelidium protococcarum]
MSNLQQSIKQQKQAFLSGLKGLRDARSGHDCCEFFMELPSKKEYPDYYMLIKKPIAIDVIQSKKHTSLDDVKADVLLMTQNAMTYNRKGSRIYKDAQEIERFTNQYSVTSAAAANNNNNETQSSGRRSSLMIKIKNPLSKSSSNQSVNTGNNEQEEGAKSAQSQPSSATATTSGGKKQLTPEGQQLLKAWKVISNLKDGDYLISGLFLELPSKVDYAFYYDVIKSPISLKEIKGKIERSSYDKAAKRKGYDHPAKAMQDDMVLMVKNAFTFNESTSDVCKDALAVLKEFRKQLSLPTPANEDFAAMVLAEQQQSLQAGIEGSGEDDMDIDGGDVKRKDGSGQASVQKPKGKVGRPRKSSGPPVNKQQQQQKKVGKLKSPFRQEAGADGLDHEDQEEDSEEDLPIDYSKYLDAYFPPKSDIQEELNEIMYKRASFEVGDVVYLSHEDEEYVTIGIIAKIWKNAAGRNRFIARWFLQADNIKKAFAGKNMEEKLVDIKLDTKELYLSDKYVEHGSMDICGRCCVMFKPDYVKGIYMGWNGEDKQKDVWFFENKLISSGDSLDIVPLNEWTDCLPEGIDEFEPPALIRLDQPRELQKLTVDEEIAKLNSLLPSRNIPFQLKARKRAVVAVEEESEQEDEFDEEESEEDEGDDSSEGVSDQEFGRPSGKAGKNSDRNRKSLSTSVQMQQRQQQQQLLQQQQQQQGQQYRPTMGPAGYPMQMPQIPQSMLPQFQNMSQVNFAQLTPQQQQMYMMMANMVRLQHQPPLQPQQQQQQLQPPIPPPAGQASNQRGSSSSSAQTFPPTRSSMAQSDHIPELLVQKVTTNRNGQIIWFNNPPRVQPPKRPLHSLKYLQFKADKEKQQQLQQSNGTMQQKKKHKVSDQVVWHGGQNQMSLYPQEQTQRVIESLHILAKSLQSDGQQLLRRQ